MPVWFVQEHKQHQWHGDSRKYLHIHSNRRGCKRRGAQQHYRDHGHVSRGLGQTSINVATPDYRILASSRTASRLCCRNLFFTSFDIARRRGQR